MPAQTHELLVPLACNLDHKGNLAQDTTARIDIALRYYDAFRAGVHSSEVRFVLSAGKSQSMKKNKVKSFQDKMRSYLRTLGILYDHVIMMPEGYGTYHELRAALLVAQSLERNGSDMIHVRVFTHSYHAPRARFLFALANDEVPTARTFVTYHRVVHARTSFTEGLIAWACWSKALIYHAPRSFFRSLIAA